MHDSHLLYQSFPYLLTVYYSQTLNVSVSDSYVPVLGQPMLEQGWKQSILSASKTKGKWLIQSYPIKLYNK